MALSCPSIGLNVIAFNGFDKPQRTFRHSISQCKDLVIRVMLYIDILSALISDLLQPSH